MKKIIILLFVTVSSTLALAKQNSTEYNSFMMDCLDYGHSYVSAEQIKQCEAEAKAKFTTSTAASSSQAQASLPAANNNANHYDLVMMDCLDYGHFQPSDEQVAQCKAQAKSEVLAIGDNQAKFLDCVDYNHSIVTEEREISCLREISEIN